MIKINNPIYTTSGYAYLSLSDWALNKEGKNVEVRIYKDDKFICKGIINKKEWIKTAKEKIKKVYYQPDNPMTFYYNFMKIEKPKTEEDELKELSKLGIF